MITLPRNPLPIHHILLKSVELWRNVIIRVLPVAIISLFITILPVFWIPSISEITLANSFKELIAHWFFFFCYGYIAIVCFAVILLMIYPHPSLQKNSVWEALVAISKRLPFIFLTAFIGQILTVAGYALFILPGFYLTFLLIFALPFSIVDKMNPVQATIQSGELVWPHWWRTAIIFALINMIYGLFVMEIHELLYQIYAKHLLTTTVYASLRHILEVVLGALYLPFYCSVLVIQLNDLKLRQQLKAT